MMTNTVIVFLRDLLPIFVLLTYLSTILKGSTLSSQFWFTTLLFGIATTLCIFIGVEYISEWFEGAGFEVGLACLLLISFIVFLGVKPLISCNKQLPQAYSGFLIIGIACFMAFKGTEFLIYFSVNGQQQDQFTNILIACILGFGICVSFSALLKFLLNELKESAYPILFWLCWSGFLAGHISQITVLLSQVDIIQLGAPMFDISHFIKDSSEYGHILHALLGYESSPSLGFILVYITAFCIPFIIDFIGPFWRPIKKQAVLPYE